MPLGNNEKTHLPDIKELFKLISESQWEGVRAFITLYIESLNEYIDNLDGITATTAFGIKLGLLFGMVLSILIAVGVPFPTFGLGAFIYPIVFVVCVALCAGIGFIVGFIGDLCWPDEPPPSSNNAEANITHDISLSADGKPEPNRDSTLKILSAPSPNHSSLNSSQQYLIASKPTNPITPAPQSRFVIPDMYSFTMANNAGANIWQAVSNVNWKASFDKQTAQTRISDLTNNSSQKEKTEIIHYLMREKNIDAAVLLIVIERLNITYAELTSESTNNNYINNMNAWLNQQWEAYRAPAIEQCWVMGELMGLPRDYNRIHDSLQDTMKQTINEADDFLWRCERFVDGVASERLPSFKTYKDHNKIKTYINHKNNINKIDLIDEISKNLEVLKSLRQIYDANEPVLTKNIHPHHRRY